MLSMNNYTQNYVDECREKVELQLSTYKKMVTTAKNQNDSKDPIKSVLKYKIGDEIKLKEDFQLLFHPFFSEMERKFV